MYLTVNNVASVIGVYNSMYPNYTANEKLRELGHAYRFEKREEKRKPEVSDRQKMNKILDIYV